MAKSLSFVLLFKGEEFCERARLAGKRLKYEKGWIWFGLLPCIARSEFS